jgi:Tfp pilus assembly protein PilN
MHLLHESGQVHNVDFLPRHYREAYARKRNQAWRIGFVAVFLSVLPIASLLQFQTQISIERELAEISRQETAVQANRARLTSLQTQLSVVEEKAKLVTYLGHPLPHTQIVNSIIQQLPESIHLTNLEVARGDVENSRSNGVLDEDDLEVNEGGASVGPSATRDLESLRRENAGRLIVNLAGVTTSTKQLHRYLGELVAQPMFDNVNLESIESKLGGDFGLGMASFEAILVVRRAYRMMDGAAGNDG